MRSFQGSNFTAIGRYDTQFQMLARIARDRDYRRGMIFGGSLGIEAFEVGAMIPEAELFSFELRRDLVRASRGYLRRPQTEFLVSTWHSIELRAPYDFICANSVLCDHPAANGKEALDTLRFEDFAAVISRLADCLAEGGTLVLCNTNYAVNDLTTSDLDLRAVTGLQPFSGQTSLFDAGSRKRIQCRISQSQYPCFFTEADADPEAAWQQVTSSVFAKGIDIRLSQPDLSEVDPLAVIDPYREDLLDADDLRRTPLAYTVTMSRDRRQPILYSEFRRDTGALLFRTSRALEPPAGLDLDVG